MCDKLNGMHPEWLNKYDDWSVGGIHFTGWKGSPEFAGYVAQWCWINPLNPSRSIYVNLPGMQNGFYARGGLFNIGADRVDGSVSKEVLDKLIRDGFDLLNNLVEKEKQNASA